jgi:flagellar hook-basal body complex protein FliE
MANINNVALNALTKLQNAATGGAEQTQQPTGGPSFGDVLKTSLQSAIDAQHTSEKVSAASLVGKADMTEVLQAVNNAEVALNTVLAVRDRVVNAYESIMRTTI